MNIKEYLKDEIREELKNKIWGESDELIKERFTNGFNSCLELVKNTVDWVNKGKNPIYKNFIRKNPNPSHIEIIELYLQNI